MLLAQPIEGADTPLLPSPGGTATPEELATSEEVALPEELVAKRGRGRGLAAFAALRQSVWFPVFAKVVVGAALLGLVAWLGERNRADETYGPVKQTETEGSLAHEAQETEVRSETVHAQTAPEAVPVPCTPPTGSEKGKTGGITADGLVVLNVANAEEMTRLPGVGPSRAQAILALRERLGKFKKVSDLLRVKGIGYKTLQVLQKKVVLDLPPPEEPKAEGEEGASKAGEISLRTSEVQPQG